MNTYKNYNDRFNNLCVQIAGGWLGTGSYDQDDETYSHENNVHPQYLSHPRTNINECLLKQGELRKNLSVYEGSDYQDAPATSVLERSYLLKSRDKTKFTPRKSVNKRVLCVWDKNYCITRYIAESIDMLIAIYSHNQALTWLLYKRHADFDSYLRSIGIRTITVEAIYKNQDFIMTTASDPDSIQIKINDTLYYRENLINVAARIGHGQTVFKVLKILIGGKILSINWSM